MCEKEQVVTIEQVYYFIPNFLFVSVSGFVWSNPKQVDDHIQIGLDKHKYLERGKPLQQQKAKNQNGSSNCKNKRVIQ